MVLIYLVQLIGFVRLIIGFNLRHNPHFLNQFWID